jgi:hypothetical protein
MVGWRAICPPDGEGTAACGRVTVEKLIAAQGCLTTFSHLMHSACTSCEMAVKYPPLTAMDRSVSSQPVICPKRCPLDTLVGGDEEAEQNDGMAVSKGSDTS